MQDHHYYCTTAYGWSVAETRDAAVTAAIRYAGSSTLKQVKKHAPGVQAAVYRVPLPKAAHYTICDYKPDRITKEDGINSTRAGEQIELTERERVFITTMTGKTIPDPENQ